jgi:hypothetical protein
MRLAQQCIVSFCAAVERPPKAARAAVRALASALTAEGFNGFEVLEVDDDVASYVMFPFKPFLGFSWS